MEPTGGHAARRPRRLKRTWGPGLFTFDEAGNGSPVPEIAGAGPASARVLDWFDPDSATVHELVRVTADFDPPPAGAIPHVDVTRDLNGDGLDDLATLAAPYWVGRRRTDAVVAGARKGRVLHSLTDISGDGVADLVIHSLRGGSGLFGQRSELGGMRFTYEVHFGTPTPAGGTTFEPDVGTPIRSDGIPLAMRQHDFDHDGRLDMMYTIINIGVFKVIGAMVSGSMSLDLEFYRMEGELYPGRPTARRKIKVVSPGNVRRSTCWRDARAPARWAATPVWPRPTSAVR